MQAYKLLIDCVYFYNINDNDNDKTINCEIPVCVYIYIYIFRYGNRYCLRLFKAVQNDFG